MFLGILMFSSQGAQKEQKSQPRGRGQARGVARREGAARHEGVARHADSAWVLWWIRALGPVFSPGRTNSLHPVFDLP